MVTFKGTVASFKPVWKIDEIRNIRMPFWAKVGHR